MRKNNHLPEQADGDHLNADNEQQGAKNKQRTAGNGAELEDPVNKEIEFDDETGKEKDHAEKSHKVNGFFGIAGEEENRHNVEQPTDVFAEIPGSPECTRHLLDIHLGELVTLLGGQHRQKIKEIAVCGQRFENRPFGSEHAAVYIL